MKQTATTLPTRTNVQKMHLHRAVSLIHLLPRPRWWICSVVAGAFIHGSHSNRKTRRPQHRRQKKHKAKTHGEAHPRLPLFINHDLHISRDPTQKPEQWDGSVQSSQPT